MTHFATARVTVIATESSIGNLIGDLVNAGCVDPKSSTVLEALRNACFRGFLVGPG